MILGVQEKVLGMGEDLMLKDRLKKTKVRVEITRDKEMSVEVDVCEKHRTLVVTGGPCCFYPSVGELHHISRFSAGLASCHRRNLSDPFDATAIALEAGVRPSIRQGYSPDVLANFGWKVWESCKP